MNRALFILLALVGMASVGHAADAPPPTYPSPNGRFEMRLTEIPEKDRGELGEAKLDQRVELIEKTSGKVMVSLGRADSNYLADTVLVWSADSKWAAYATRQCPNRIEEGETKVYFWNGATFNDVPLPARLPDPKIKFPKGAGDSVKPYGGGTSPVKWLKSGALVLSIDDMFLSRSDEKSYTGTVEVTIGFDKQHRASVQKVGKTETTVEK
jgi:hypothetical protein